MLVRILANRECPSQTASLKTCIVVLQKTIHSMLLSQSENIIELAI